MGLFYGHNAIIPPVIAASNGYLYNAYTVIGNASNLINGMHVPSVSEWDILISYAGGSGVAGGKMKKVGFDNWLSPNTGAVLNEYNFTALGSGERHEDGTFSYKKSGANFWTTSSAGGGLHYMKLLWYLNNDFEEDFWEDQYGYSIRCVRTLTAQEQIDFSDGDIVEVVTDYDYNGYNVVRIGTQGWSVGNLKTTHYLDGTPLTKVEGATWSSLTTEGYCAYDNDEGNV